MREVKRKDPTTKRNKTVLQPPVLTGHADYINPFEFTMMMRGLAGLEFDVMLEAKAKDLALVRLRKDLARCAPELAAKSGVDAQLADTPEPDAIPAEDSE
jgi:UV DNA damage endonuclease